MILILIYHNGRIHKFINYYILYIIYMYDDYIFRLIVYYIAIYLIITNNDIYINLCGWTILLSHIYKDLVTLIKWPKWSEYIGIILAILLINNGIKINNFFILFIGLSKLLAHLRQLILKDYRYYY